MLSIDPADPEAAPDDELTFRVEEIERLYVAAGKLWVPGVDPQGSTPTSGDALAVASAAGSWVTGATFDVFPTHVFDVAVTADGVWLAGVVSGVADEPSVWLSTDGGATFTRSLHETVGGVDFSRYYALVAIGDDLYVQRMDTTNAGSVSQYWSHAGQEWTEEPAWVFPEGVIAGAWKPTQIDTDKAIFLRTPAPLGGGPAPSNLIRMTTPGTFEIVSDSFPCNYDLDSDGNVYMLCPNIANPFSRGAVRKCSDILAVTPAWTKVADAPPGAAGFAVSPDGSFAWFGTADSAIWSVSLA